MDVLVVLELACEAKVSNFYIWFIAVIAQEYIQMLQVSMYYTSFMNISDRSDNLLEYVSCLIFRQSIDTQSSQVV